MSFSVHKKQSKSQLLIDTLFICCILPLLLDDVMLLSLNRLLVIVILVELAGLDVLQNAYFKISLCFFGFTK